MSFRFFLAGFALGGAPALLSSAVSTVRPAPADAIGPFYVGLSALDVEANERADKVFEDLAKRLPDEPAIWSNLGIARLRVGDLPGAEMALGEAAKLDSRNDQIILLQATIDEEEGQFQQAITRLQNLADPDAAVLYRLTQLLGRTGQNADLPAQLQAFDRLRQRQPANPVAAFGRARLLARMEDRTGLEAALQELAAKRAQWSEAEIRQLEAARKASNAGNFRAAGAALTFLQNLRQATPEYQAALASLGAGGGSVGRPLRELLRYHAPETSVSAADAALSFTVAPEAGAAEKKNLFLALELGAKDGTSRLALTEKALSPAAGKTLPFTGGSALSGRNAVCVTDLNNDFLPDLAVVGAGGLQLWTQGEDGHFSSLPPTEDLRAAFAAPAHGVWALDYDADGDLDLLVARDGMAPQLYRNNSDGTFTAVDTFASFPEVRDVYWADLDGDGDNDLAVLDANGRVLVAWNDRAGTFSAPVVVADASFVALTCADLAGSGELSLLALEKSGTVRELHFDRERHAWQAREVARWNGAPDLAGAFAHQRATLDVADLDNNGAADIVASADDVSAIWLNEGGGHFLPLAAAPALSVGSITDLDGDGFLDLVGLSGQSAVVAHGHGTKGYHWQSIRTRTLGARADSRINSLGLGSRIEIRAGALLAMAPVVASRTHFGLGAQKQVGVARIVWPNGVAQVEFDLLSDQEVTATQRLKGSCPWVFTRTDGRFHFVKDFIWRSPLGMRINSQDTAGVDQTEDWILIPGTDLAAEKGAYEIRITAELWETHFFDHVSLKVVDHPATETALVDERFVPTQQPKLAVLATTPARPLAEPRDQAGRDVAQALAASDGVCVNDFPLGRFQGIAEDHWIEFRLPADAPANQPLLLVGEGWIYPTDSSLNVSISQGSHPKPQGLVLEAFDPARGWQAVSGNLGFPAGKNKLVAIPLPRDASQGGNRRFRLRTNLEIYWDRLGWAAARPEADLHIQPAETLTAELRHRGFSQLAAPERRRPDFPTNYEALAGSGARWRDLEGYYTRYGDVRELLRQTDDRYVIMNAGDEMVLRFAAPPPPPVGWTRDFVLVGDGWVKDGDFNTAASRTVGPLPSHAQHHYAETAVPLTDDPVYQQHQEDWERFHTRYVAPVSFERGLMTDTSPRPEKNLP